MLRLRARDGYHGRIVLMTVQNRPQRSWYELIEQTKIGMPRGAGCLHAAQPDEKGTERNNHPHEAPPHSNCQCTCSRRGTSWALIVRGDWGHHMGRKAAVSVLIRAAS